MKERVEIVDHKLARTRSRAMDYIDLMKPELTILSVLTTLCGIYLGTLGDIDLLLFLHAAIETMLVGGGAGTLNQFFERKFDAVMKRTERRPLPAGRLSASDALTFGATISMLGILHIFLFINVLTGILAVLTLASYLCIYTPLKRKSWYNTIIGGIPGALPAMAGWTTARNEISTEAWILFAILFCWQMPHFFALAWMYRKDYARAGYRMITTDDDAGTRTARQILFYLILLIPISALPSALGLTGTVYLIGAMILGMLFFAYGLYFSRYTGSHASESIAQMNYFARKLFFASLLYLPLLMLLMVLDKA